MKITQTNQTFQHRKVPRYIYHLTNQKAYKSMLADGAIMPSQIDPYNLHQGVHAIELSNFFKFWGHNKAWDEKGEALQESLLRQAARWIKSAIEGKNKLVILKIPTDQLDQDKLKVRSQNRFFQFKLKDRFNFNPNEHLRCETPATEARRYKNRKEAIEYIYQDKIPIHLAEPVGNIVDIPALRSSREFDKNNPVKEILKHVFEGSSEGKGLKELI